VKAVLFDLDRTLVDVQSHTDYAAAVAEVEEMIGSWDDPPTPPTGWDGPTRRAMGILVSLAGDQRWQEVSNLIERHERAAVGRSTAMPGLGMALQATASIPRAVVTLLSETTAREVLVRHGIGIDSVVGRRPDLATKPAPDQLWEACRILRIEPTDAVMVGDSAWDAAAARAAGCGFLGVTWGSPTEFGSETAVAETLKEAVAALT
jgi:phosphoglycolate phosphatase